ncbi:MAG: phosphoribulokinase, partial [Arenicellales bacterium]
MSEKHPVIAVTGSSGAGTSTVKAAFEHIFHIENINACIIEGDSFHSYDRQEMCQKIRESEAKGGTFSHFGVDANDLERLEKLFYKYGQSGNGERRYYLHNQEEANRFDQKPGEFTPWESIQADTDM